MVEYCNQEFISEPEEWLSQKRFDNYCSYLHLSETNVIDPINRSCAIYSNTVIMSYVKKRPLSDAGSKKGTGFMYCIVQEIDRQPKFGKQHDKHIQDIVDAAFDEGHIIKK